MRIDYRPGLDGLRAIAVVLVLVFHADLGWLPGGFLGVSVFFTLSGFLIASLLLGELASTGSLDLGSFWERRFRRLLPASVVTILGVIIAAHWLSTPVEQSRLRGDAIASLLYVGNWRSIFSNLSYEDIFSTRSPLVHLWSLGIEEQMYLAIPLLVVALARLRMRSGDAVRTVGICAAFLAVLSTVASAVLLDGDRLYYGTDARASELLVGVAAAAFIGPSVLSRTRRPSVFYAWIPVLALVGVVLVSVLTTTDSPWVYAGYLPLFALLSLVCVIGAVVPGPLSSILSAWPLVWIGKVSYGLYLFHWPVFTWLDQGRVGFGGVGLFAVRLGVTTAVTVLSYFLVERPIRVRRWLVSRRSLIASAVLVTGATLMIAAVSLDSVRDTPEIDVRVLSTLATPDDSSGDSASGDQSLRTSWNVLVIGDSTAENIARALAEVESLGVISAGVIGCPLVAAVEVFDRPRASQETSYCPDTVDIVRANADRIDVVFIVGGVANQWAHRSTGSGTSGAVVEPGSTPYTEEYDSLMESFQSVLAPEGVPIVVLDNPRTRPDEGVLGDEPEAHAAWRSQIERWDAQWATVERVSIDDRLAPAESVEGRRQRPDGVHLEEAFAADLAITVIAPRLESTLNALFGILDDIGCRVAVGNGHSFDLDLCRTR